jgi:hypothetical protein
MQKKISSTRIKTGDQVRVRSVEEIQSMLDNKNRYMGGLLFIDDMAQYCGKTFRVVKKVKKVFDSVDWKMKKISQDVVILDNVFCHGYGPFKECDRTCFFFWKEEWLEKRKD